MPLAEAVKYVAAAYAVILVVFIAYLLVYSRRIGRLQREGILDYRVGNTYRRRFAFAPNEAAAAAQ